MTDENQLFLDIKSIAQSVLQLDSSNNSIQIDSPLLGHVPELDSMAVVTILTTIEETFGIVVEDDEVSAEVFQSWRSLTNFVADKLSD